MVRHFISAVALVACAAVYAYAGDQVTLVLTNGQRVSGALGNGNNVNNGQLSLNNQNYGIDQVAVIDVAGGSPPAIELSRITKGNSPQAVVMRSGHAEAGRFVNITGDTLQWVDHNGRTQNYPLSDVARIYLNVQSGSAAYSNSTAQSTATTGQSPSTQDQAGGVRVMANQQWTSTGVSVKKGDLVSFQTTGQVSIGNNMLAGPDGKGDMHSASYPVAGMPGGGLIGKVGTSAPFPIGSNSQPIVMPANGTLMLGVNDNELSDNSGYFSVVIRRAGHR